MIKIKDFGVHAQYNLAMPNREVRNILISRIMTRFGAPMRFCRKQEKPCR